MREAFSPIQKSDPGRQRNSIQHGAANENPNNLLELAGNVWSTNLDQATNSQYTLDLGGTFDVTTVRMWPRADTCCTERWQNLEVHLYADDGTGNPGALIASSDDPRLAAPGGNIPLEITFAAGSTEIEELSFTAAFAYPEEDDPAILSSASPGSVVGTLAALNEFGGAVPSATFALVAGPGDTDNALYDIDGSELQVSGDLSGIDGVEHSVRVQAMTAEGTVEGAFTFTVLLDSDNDSLIDSWELMFGSLADFMTGGDSDGDGENDENEFREGTDPSVVPDVALFRETFNFDDGGFVEEATGNSPIPSVHSAVTGTWSMAGDDSGPATNTLISPDIMVPVTGGIRVSFDHRYSIEPEWDGTALQVSIDGGPFRTVPMRTSPRTATPSSASSATISWPTEMASTATRQTTLMVSSSLASPKSVASGLGARSRSASWARGMRVPKAPATRTGRSIPSRSISFQIRTWTACQIATKSRPMAWTRWSTMAAWVSAEAVATSP